MSEKQCSGYLYIKLDKTSRNIDTSTLLKLFNDVKVVDDVMRLRIPEQPQKKCLNCLHYTGEGSTSRDKLETVDYVSYCKKFYIETSQEELDLSEFWCHKWEARLPSSEVFTKNERY